MGRQTQESTRMYEKATEKPGALEIEAEEQAADCNTRHRLAAEVLIDREASSVISPKVVRRKVHWHGVGNN